MEKSKRIQARIERAEKAIDSFTKQGYKKEEKTVTMLTANILAIVICAPFLILEWILYNNAGGTFDAYLDLSWSGLLVFFLGYFVLIFIHELIHYVCMGLFGKKWDNIELGFQAKTLTPYCTCQEPLTKLQYLLSLLMPTLILGTGLAIWSLISLNGIIFVYALFLTFGGGGDFLIIALLLLSKRKNIKVIDHPEQCGCYIMYKE